MDPAEVDAADTFLRMDTAGRTAEVEAFGLATATTSLSNELVYEKGTSGSWRRCSANLRHCSTSHER
jgi:hypothetical protein